tara:strand:- start:1168 stop:1464 length:297 start_codon:yes stop_codon:yes gene_type:complete
MLRVTVADCENTFIGIFQTTDPTIAIRRATDNLRDEHTWNSELQFYKADGPPWSNEHQAAGFLARPEDEAEDREYLLHHEGTAWVYVEPVRFDVMIED